MAIFLWLKENGYSLLQTFSIIAGFTLTIITLRVGIKSRKVSNLIAITQQHRSIWMQLFDHPELSRILDDSVDLKKTPVTLREQLFVNFLILHLSATWRAAQKGELIRLERLKDDIQSFFSLPLTKTIWEDSKKFQDADFVAFVESCSK